MNIYLYSTGDEAGIDKYAIFTSRDDIKFVIIKRPILVILY